MKRMLNLLALTTLSTSAILTVGLVLNSNVVKNLSLKTNLKSVNDNPFKTPMTGTSGVIESLTTDGNGNVYAGSYKRREY